MKTIRFKEKLLHLDDKFLHYLCSDIVHCSDKEDVITIDSEDIYEEIIDRYQLYAFNINSSVNKGQFVVANDKTYKFTTREDAFRKKGKLNDKGYTVNVFFGYDAI